MRLYTMMMDLLNALDYISLEYFIKKHKVSKRTVQNDISYLMQMSSRKGYQLHMRRGRGYLLEVTNQELLQEFITSLQGEQTLNMKDRVKNIVAFLSLQQDFISMDKIADAFSISKTSVKNEMDAVGKLVKSYHLQLEKKSHYGVRIVGPAKIYKEMLVDLYFNDNIFVKETIEQQKQVHDFAKVNAALVSQFEKENVNINYNELKNVIVWLEISTYYAYLTKEKDDCAYSEKHLVVERIAWNMKEVIEDCYDIHLGQESIEQFIEILRKNVRQKKASVHLGNCLTQDVNEFLQEIDELYDTKFYKDEVFKKSLLTHVSLLIDRLHQKISYKNTLITEICIRYPMIFNIAIRFSDMLKDKYDVEVTQDEAGFIATHFLAHMEKERTSRLRKFGKIGVVCSSGGGSAYLIKMQIESLFSSAEVVTFSFLEMEELEQFKPDLIFTIMPLDQEFHAPVIFIKELLDDLDLMRIRQVLQYDNCDSFSIEDANSYVYSIFHKDFFKICNEKDYHKLLKRMAKQIEDSGFGGEHYMQYVMEREAYMSTVYLHGVCIPHPIEICAKKNLISVCILENPIVYEEKEVKIIFMVALTKDDYEVHKDITKKLYQLMNDEKRLERILDAKTLEEFLIVMKELEGGVIRPI